MAFDINDFDTHEVGAMERTIQKWDGLSHELKDFEKQVNSYIYKELTETKYMTPYEVITKISDVRGATRERLNTKAARSSAIDNVNDFGREYNNFKNSISDHIKTSTSEWIQNRGHGERLILEGIADQIGALQAYGEQFEENLNKLKAEYEIKKQMTKDVVGEKRIEETFGDFSPKKDNGEPKSSEELIAERNKRLAILSKLDAKNVDTRYCVRDVVKLYDEEIKKALDRETLKTIKEHREAKKEIPESKMKSMFKKFKNIFHIGKPVEDVVSDDLLDGDKIYANTCAMLILNKTASQSHKKETIDALTQASESIASQTPMVKNENVSKLIEQVFEEQKIRAVQQLEGEELDNLLENEEIRRAYILSPVKINKDGKCRAKSAEAVSRDKNMLIEYLAENNKYRDCGMNEHGEMAYTFKDKKIQALYESVISTFNTVSLQTEKCAEVEDKLYHETNNTMENIKGNVEGIER